MGLSVLW